MFGRAPKVVNTKLDAVAERLLDEMIMYGPEAPGYSEMLEHLQKIEALRQPQTRKPVDPNAMALVAGNLLGILIIVAYEQKHVVTSKGLGFVLKSQKP